MEFLKTEKQQLENSIKNYVFKISNDSMEQNDTLNLNTKRN